MGTSTNRPTLAKRRAVIGTKVRELRKARKWTQAELAGHLGLSQNRLSELESGAGSFSAEQFLLILQLFNVSVNHFAEQRDQELELQNALVQLGALHLQESADVLPSEQLAEVNRVVREVLVEGSPRLVTGLAPVFVRHAAQINLPKLQAQLAEIGRDRRLAWVVANTLSGLVLSYKEHPEISKQWSRIYRRSEVALFAFLDFALDLKKHRADSPPPDILDPTIRSKRTLEEVQTSASAISREWGIVSGLQPEDFQRALEAARVNH